MGGGRKDGRKEGRGGKDGQGRRSRDVDISTSRRILNIAFHQNYLELLWKKENSYFRRVVRCLIDTENNFITHLINIIHINQQASRKHN